MYYIAEKHSREKTFVDQWEASISWRKNSRNAKSLLGGCGKPKFSGENFLGWISKCEIHEVFSLKSCPLWYTIYTCMQIELSIMIETESNTLHCVGCMVNYVHWYVILTCMVHECTCSSTCTSEHNTQLYN